MIYLPHARIVSIVENHHQSEHIFITTVIRFETEHVEVEEGYNVEVNTILTSNLLDFRIQFGNLAVTVEVNKALSTAKLGRPQLSI